MAIILWDRISNFEDKIFLINVFELLLSKNSRPQKFTDPPSEERKIKPYVILTSSEWPDLIQTRSFSHTYCLYKVIEAGGQPKPDGQGYRSQATVHWWEW